VNQGALVAKLQLPFACLRTCHEGASEVRVYRNDLTGALRVGKRTSALGHELSVALTEAKLLELIKHPNIVQVYEVARVSDTGYDDPALQMFELTMPFFERGSVFDAFVRGERFSVLTACRYAERALRGLAELHRRRILHRDVKSGNVFLVDDGSLLKVGDLGIAEAMDSEGLADAHPYPQLYSPPETFTLKKASVRSDIYGVGLMLHEMLNGPFDYASYNERSEYAVRLARGKPAPRKADLRMLPHVPPALRRIVRKATDAKPDRRYPSALAMSGELSRAHLVDWDPVQGDERRKEWLGVSAKHGDRRFRIVAERKRSAWKLTAEKHVSRWQQFLTPVIADSYEGRAAMELFDQVVKCVAS
jgi:serine/threonine protein kinase